MTPPDGAAAHDALALRRRPRRLPPEVVEQIDLAAQLCDDLRASGVDLRFDSAGDGARLRAYLVDAAGEIIREVALTDVVELAFDVP